MQRCSRNIWSDLLLFAIGIAPLVFCRTAIAVHPTVWRTSVNPTELPDSILHNPDMGWVLYENYPLDQDPKGSSTLLTLPNKTIAGVNSYQSNRWRR